MQCLQCRHGLSRADEIFFYLQAEKAVHLAFRPECRAFLENAMEIQEQSKKKIKILCKSCGSGVGSQLPFGPNGASFVAFGADAVILCERPLARKQKWSDILEHISYSQIERRTDADFFGNIQDRATAPADSSFIDKTSFKRVQYASATNDFDWNDLTRTMPRQYQIEAFVEALSQDLIVVIPTGLGKTLVAILLLARMARLNRGMMGLFIVDRVPLVFQQSQAIVAETGLKVCALCGENKTKHMVSQLLQGSFDVLVATGGAFEEMTRKKELDLAFFSTIVVDEAHHVTGDHCFTKILSAWYRMAPRARPRVLGLTASPFSAKTLKSASERLQALRNHFGGAAVFKPSLPPPQQSLQWKVVETTSEQILMLNHLANFLRLGAESLRTCGHGDFFSPGFSDIETLLSDQGALGRVRGALRIAHHEIVSSQAAKDPISSRAVNDIAHMHQAVVSFELCLVLGINEAREHLMHLETRPTWMNLDATHSVGDRKRSPQFEQLLALLSHAQSDSRIIVFVETRDVVRRLCKALQSDIDIHQKFHPRSIVGHGGVDGMDWHNDQSNALEAFAEGQSRLLVCTSVLEEGLDVSACDLVVRFQGVGSLISLVQSRGRARKQHSRVVVLLPQSMQHRILDIEDRERLMDSILKDCALREVVPSQNTLTRIQDIKCWRVTNSSSSVAEEESQLYEHEEIDRHRVIINVVCNNVTCTEETLKDNVQHSIEQRVLGLKVQRLEVLRPSAGHVFGIPQVFQKRDRVVLVCAKARDGYRTTSALYHEFRSSWDFQVFSCNSSGHPSVALSEQALPKRPYSKSFPLPLRLEAAKVTVGRFVDEKTFVEQFVISDERSPFLASIAFRKGESIDIEVADIWQTLAAGLFGLLLPQLSAASSIKVKIDLRILESFAFMHWGRIESSSCVLYLPVTAAAVVSVVFGELHEEERICGFDHPLLRAISQNYVYAFHLDVTSGDAESILAHLLQNAHLLPCKVFDARIANIQQEMQHTFFLKEPLACHNDDTTTRECHWALGVLATSCTSLQQRHLAAIHQQCLEVAQDRLGSLNPVLGWQEQVSAATSAVYKSLYVSKECYWDDISVAFHACLQSIRTMNRKQILRIQQPLPRGHIMVKRVIVTPSRLVLLQPLPMKTSRLLRRFPDHDFISVQFLEEQFQKLHGTETLPHLENVLRVGIQIGGVTYRYFGASASQLRDHGAMFVAAASLDEVRALRYIVVKPECQFDSVAKYTARLGLYLTADTPTIHVSMQEAAPLSDRQAHDGKLTTDGSGKLAMAAARKISECLGLDFVPTAFQFRWAGIKGVAVTVPDGDKDLLEASQDLGRACLLLYRPSMVKFEGEDFTFCVVDYSRHHQVFLNREIITLLESLHGLVPEGCWDPRNSIQHRQEAVLQEAAEMFSDGQVAANNLSENVMHRWKCLFDMPDGATNSHIIVEPFWLSVLGKLYRMRVRSLVGKSRIPVPMTDGCLLLGVPDPMGVLRDGEVFVQQRYQIANNFEGQAITRIVTGAVMVYRNPCLHPGDVQHLQAVHKDELVHLVNVIVFPVVGKTSVPASCSGGDLDGDKYSVIWAKDLVPPQRVMQDPADYDAILQHAGESIGRKIETVMDICEDDLIHFFCRVVANDTLGKIAHVHLALCDLMPNGALDPMALKLAEAQSLAVDFPKTGVLPKIPEESVRQVELKGFPDFMQKPEKVSYCSRKTLGQLYRRCVSLDVDIQTCAPFDIDPRLLLHGREAWKDEALSLYRSYRNELSRILSLHGLKHEGEVVLACAVWWPSTVSDKGRASQRIRDHFAVLVEGYRDMFFAKIAHHDRWAKASAWYEVAYSTQADDMKERPSPCRSFAWIVGDVLLEIEGGTHNQVLPMASLHNLIGRGVVHQLAEHLSGIEHTISSRTNAMRAVQVALNSHCERQIQEHDGQPFQVSMFGSVALLLCEAESDIDLCMLVNPGGFLEPFVAAPQASAFRNLSELKQGRHFLQMVASPAVDTIATSKREVLGERVALPLIKIEIDDSLRPGESVKIDITCSQDGLRKALHFYDTVHCRGAPLLGAVILVTSWARSCCLVRSANSCDAPLIPAEWQALILHLIHDDHSLRTFTRGLPKLGTWPTHQADQIQRLMDFARHTQEHDMDLIGSLFLGILRALSQLAGAVTFIWPIAFQPRHEINGKVITVVSSRAREAFQMLLVSRSARVLFQSLDSGGQVVVCRRLSRAVSLRIQDHCAFHGTYLSAVSGADVKLESIEGNNTLLLHASGTAGQIFALQEELHNYADAARLIGMPTTKASRYFMEGSTRVFLVGSNALTSQVCFKETIASFVPLHSMCERVAPQLCPAISIETWEDFALNRFLELWCGQLAKLPVHSTSHMESLSATVRFGTFYLTDATEKLPETSLTMSVGELEEAMVKNRRNRKSCWREIPDCNAMNERVCQAGEPLKMTDVKPSRGLVGSAQSSKAKRKKQRNTSGIGSSFCAGLLSSNVVAGEHLQQCLNVYERALLALGFVQESTACGTCWTISVMASSSFEINVSLNDSLQIEGMCERPLSWVHATLINSRENVCADAVKDGLLRMHDVRLKVQTVDIIDQNNPLWQFGAPYGVAPIEVRGCHPIPAPSLDARSKDRLVFARRIDRNLLLESAYDSAVKVYANIKIGEEFMGKSFQMHRNFCDLELRLDTRTMRRAVSGQRQELRKMGERLWHVSRRVSEALDEFVRQPA